MEISPWATEMRRIVASLALAVAIGSAVGAVADGSSAPSAPSRLGVNIRAIHAGDFYPGRSSSVSFSYHVSEKLDALIDILDDTGYYSGRRVALDVTLADDAQLFVSIPAPNNMRDPESAYVSIKLVPPGGEWWQRVYEVEVPIHYIYATPIVANLYYKSPLSFFNGEFTRDYSNHDGVRVFVRRNGSRYELGSSQLGAGGGENLTMDLETGVIARETVTTGRGPAHMDLSPGATGQVGAQYLSAIAQLKAHFEHVETGRGSDLGADYPQLRAANLYLKDILQQLSPGTRDLLTIEGLHTASGDPDHWRLRVGESNSVRIRYAAVASRDVIFTLRIGDVDAFTSRMLVTPGTDTIVIPFFVPANTAGHTMAQLTVALLATGDPGAPQTVGAAKIEEIFPANSLDAVYSSATVASFDQLYAAVNYASITDLDLKVDLVGPDQDILESHLYGLPAGPAGFFNQIRFVADVRRQHATTYTLVFALLTKPSSGARVLDRTVRAVTLIRD